MAFELRDWQIRCKTKYFEKLCATDGHMIFKVEACVGAGKSKMMAELAYQHLLGEWVEDYPLDFAIFVAPNTAIIGNRSSRDNEAFGILGALEDRGIWALERITTASTNRLEFDFNPEPKQSAAGMTGVAAVMTYHYFRQEAVAQQILKWCAAGKRIGIFLDEIQFVPDAGSAWSDSTTRLEEKVQLFVPFSGTWWRTDERLIFGQNKERLENDFSYTYGEAIADGIVRPLSFWVPNTTVRVKDFGGDIIDERSTDQFLAGIPAEVKFKLLEPNGWFVEQMIKRAAIEVNYRTSKYTDTGCVVICPPGFRDDEDDTKEAKTEQNRIAETIHRRLEKILGVKATLILHGDPSTKIQEFRESKERFIVAVNRISIGADIPRLRIALILRDLSGSRLLFDQILGRIARRRPQDDDEAALAIMPPFENMCEFAQEQMERQKDYTPKPSKPCTKCGRIPCRCPDRPRVEVCPICGCHPCICRKDIPLETFIEFEKIKDQHIHAGEVVGDRYTTIIRQIRDIAPAFRHIDVARNGQLVEMAEKMAGGFRSNQSNEQQYQWRAQQTAASWARLHDGIPPKVRSEAFVKLFWKPDDKDPKFKFGRAWTHINDKFLTPHRWKQIHHDPVLLTMEKLTAIDDYLNAKIGR